MSSPAEEWLAQQLAQHLEQCCGLMSPGDAGQIAQACRDFLDKQSGVIHTEMRCAYNPATGEITMAFVVHGRDRLRQLLPALDWRWLER